MSIWPLIGILVNTPKPLPSYEISENLMVNLVVFSCKDINWHHNTITGFLFKNGKWEKTTSSFPSVIYNRLYNSKKTFINKLEKVIGKDKVFNCITKFDKSKVDEILRISDVMEYLPDTFMYQECTVLDLLHKYNRLILKPCIGCLGREVYRLEISKDNKYQLFHHLHLPKIESTNGDHFISKVNNLVNKKRFILQQFVPFDKVDQSLYDIRIYVQKGFKGQWSVSGGYSRVSYGDSYITNLSNELKSFNEILNSNNNLSIDSLEKMKYISLHASKAIENSIGHLGELCVDFALYQGKPWIIEVNGKTQKQMVYRVNDSHLSKIIFLKPIAYARFLTLNEYHKKVDEQL